MGEKTITAAALRAAAEQLKKARIDFKPPLKCNQCEDDGKCIFQDAWNDLGKEQPGICRLGNRKIIDGEVKFEDVL